MYSKHCCTRHYFLQLVLWVCWHKSCLQYNIPWNEHVTKCFLCSICCMKLACRIRFYFSQWLLQWKHCVFSWHVGWVFLFQDSPSETELSHSMPKTWSCCTWILRILKAIIIIFPQFPRKIKVFNQYIIKNTPLNYKKCNFREWINVELSKESRGE